MELVEQVRITGFGQAALLDFQGGLERNGEGL